MQLDPSLDSQRRLFGVTLTTHNLEGPPSPVQGLRGVIRCRSHQHKQDYLARRLVASAVKDSGANLGGIVLDEDLVLAFPAEVHYL